MEPPVSRRAALFAPMDTKRSQSQEREIEPATLDAALERIAQRRILARGEVDFPCVPALFDAYVK